MMSHNASNNSKYSKLRKHLGNFLGIDKPQYSEKNNKQRSFFYRNTYGFFVVLFAKRCFQTFARGLSNTRAFWPTKPVSEVKSKLKILLSRQTYKSFLRK